jgi:spore coat polysaccharide biosynthesis protein SpsF
MSCVVFITVRSASTRLPKKTLRKINGKPLIQNLVERLSKIHSVKEVIVCTTIEKSDNELVKYLQKIGVKTFRGSSTDILGRLYQAALKWKLKHFIVVEGDDLFCDSDLIKKTCQLLKKSNYEFIYWKNLPLGVTSFGIKTKPLFKLIKKFSTKNVETGWGSFILKSGVFKVGALKQDDYRLERPDIRLTIDYPEDLQLARKIIKNLPINFSLLDIISILDENNEWLKINENMKQKYWKNFTSKTKSL